MYSDNQQEFYNGVSYYQDDVETKSYLKLAPVDPSFSQLIKDEDYALSKSEHQFGQNILQQQLQYPHSAYSPGAPIIQDVGITGLGAAGFSDSEFGSTGLGACDTDLDFDLKELVGPMLADMDPFPQEDVDFSNHVDLDLTLQLDEALGMSDLTLEEDTPVLGGAMLPLGVGTAATVVTHLETSPTRAKKSRRSERSPRAAAIAARVTLAQALDDSDHLDYTDRPTYSSDPTFNPLDLGTSITTTPRQRQPRVSYDTLTPQQRQQRIRQLNNQASKHYRGRKVEKDKLMGTKEEQETLRNQLLRKKCQGLQRLRDESKEYYENFMRQHMSGVAPPPH